jgi:hypothetical protein
MADRTTPPPRTGRERLKSLAQAALNADVTVDQLDGILSGMGETLDDLNKTMSGMEGTLEYFEHTLGVFNKTLTRLDEVTPRLEAVIDQFESVVGRIERIVDIAEAMMAPLTVTENAMRGVFGLIRGRS